MGLALARATGDVVEVRFELPFAGPGGGGGVHGDLEWILSREGGGGEDEKEHAGFPIKVVGNNILEGVTVKTI